MTIDLNCDLGEFDIRHIKGVDAMIMPYISSVNIACGGHAGSHFTMQSIVQLALENKVFIGGHPSYPDRKNFGRKTVHMSLAELQNSLIDQISQLKQIVQKAGGILRHIKPHGALYNDAAIHSDLAGVIVESLKAIDPTLILIAPQHSSLINSAQKSGIKVMIEVFADRAYAPTGQLLNRNQSNAVITDPNQVIARAVRMIKDKQLISIDGSTIPVEPDTVCLHGDHPKSVYLARGLAEAFNRSGIKITKNE